eukprot:TRINITY_DN537_c0_g2_i1.p1 TRINITY_DN537_c0_g2~~TRINITY_DN537_c0_g2_i1.p1  ORF type:complete len:357 (+),score=96.77 TRINITY_DN537_c0_g2_i1:162-1232(+)
MKRVLRSNSSYDLIENANNIELDIVGIEGSSDPNNLQPEPISSKVFLIYDNYKTKSNNENNENDEEDLLSNKQILNNLIENKEEATIISLKHPNKSNDQQYIMVKKKPDFTGGRLLEINQLLIDGLYSSWFIDQTIQQDGSLYICTPIDPLYFLLPFFEEHIDKYFKNVKTLLMESQDGYEQFLHILPDITIDLICDQRELDNEIFYRLNKDKVLDWLCCRIYQLKEYFMKNQHYLSNQAKAATFVTKKQKEISEDDLIKRCIGFLSEYINDEWFNKLSDHFNIGKVDKTQSLKLRKALMKANDPIRFMKQRKANNSEDEIKPAKKKPKTFAQKRLDRIDKTGMKSLTSFFQKKKK